MNLVIAYNANETGELVIRPGEKHPRSDPFVHNPPADHPVQSDKIPVGIIGLGRIASLLENDKLREKPCTHSGAVAANPDCVLVCGCDRDRGHRELFAERWKADVYADARTMLDKHNCSILIIATYPDSHRYYSELALRYRVPLVICEKPLADTLKDAKKIAALSRSGDIKIIVNHERRYSADYLKVKSLLKEGSLGALCGVKATLAMGRKRLLDVLWHDGTHLFDAMMFLTDSRIKHTAKFGVKLSSSSGVSFLAGMLESEKQKIPFIIEVDADRDMLVFEIEISLAKGLIRIGNGVFEIWQSAPSPYAEGFRSLKKIEGAWEGKTGYFSNMLADAVACLRDKERLPQSSAADALSVIQYLHTLGRRTPNKSK
jgi:predicted dehydrogenase